jgi:hypothetical protein
LEVSSFIRLAIDYTDEVLSCVSWDSSCKGEDSLAICRWVSELVVLLLITGYCLQLKRNAAVNILFESWASDSLQDTLVHRTSLEMSEAISVISKGFAESIFVNFAGQSGPV